MSSQKSSGKRSETVDHDQDRYPDFRAVIDAVLSADALPEGPIERLEITAQASGEANWRVWTPRAEEPEGGHIPQHELS